MTLGFALTWSIPGAALGVFVLGIAKECWDHFAGSGFCLRDIAANSLGISAATVLISGVPLP